MEIKVFINREEVKAEGIYSSHNNSLKVLSNSEYKLEPTSSISQRYLDLSEQLHQKEVLSDGMFLQDYEFGSPSTAASIVLNRQSNGLIEWKNKEGITLKSLILRHQLITYIEENINNEDVLEYIKTCKEIVKETEEKFPLNELKNLPIEKWDKRGSRDTLTYWIERGTGDMLSGFLGTNRNKLVYQDKDGNYAGAGVTLKGFKGKDIYEKYQHFISWISESIIKYTDEDYLENKDTYALPGANVLSIKLLSFYKPESILLLSSPTIFLRLFDNLGLEGYSLDSVISNIHLKRFLYDNLDENYHIYAVSRLLFQFYKKEIEPIYGKESEEAPLKEVEETIIDLNDIFVSDELIRKSLNVLERKKNLIFQGVPGVGKTFIIDSLIKSEYTIFEDESNIEAVQFHQSYSYEEFIEGFRPKQDGSGSFEVTPGTFKEFSLKALNDPDNDYFFIIDEINRGNLSKIFGELLMLIENDKREKSKIVLPYSKEEFTVPKNLYIIGTMNIADRSLSLVDYALRRRFSFVTLKPAFNTKKFNDYMLKVLKYTEEELNAINNTMTNVNNLVVDNLSESFVIGHSYFIEENRGESFDEFINEIYEFEILPLIDEYFFDDAELKEKFKELMMNE